VGYGHTPGSVWLLSVYMRLGHGQGHGSVLQGPCSILQIMTGKAVTGRLP
jgi:hypothetical protein